MGRKGIWGGGGAGVEGGSVIIDLYSVYLMYNLH